MTKFTFYHVAKSRDCSSILRLGLLPTADNVFATGGILTFSNMLAGGGDPGFARVLLDLGPTAGVNLSDDPADWGPRAGEVRFEVAIDEDDPNLLHMHRWWWRYQGIIRPDRLTRGPS